ncbi:MAG: cytochrome b/b6 domain-containing protein [Cardiobacteriaceae bacterium]|nr:cytochrome b/b6 domain-containing protein [Cardiobacteriaceae bacterium]
MKQPPAHAFVWDILVRLTHWGVAGAVIANLFFTGRGDEDATHRILGMVAAGLVIIRLLWAMTLAKKPARLRDLVPTPGNAVHHLRDLQRGEETAEPGHNALGLLAVWAMWFCIVGLAFTGYHANEYTDLAERFSLDDWHEYLAKALLVLFILHVSAVFLTSWRLKRNLVRPMIHK